jgi:hypothetical protein
MASTDAGTPAAGNGQPPSEPTPRRGLRDTALGKLLLLGLVLGAAFVATRSCASAGMEVTADEAKEIAVQHASFMPCAQNGCRLVQFVQRGIPPRPYWIVGLAEELDAEGQPGRTESFLVDAATGEVSRL